MRINDLLLPKYANVNVDDGAVPSPLFPSPQFAQAARDLAANGPRSPWPPGFQPPTSAAAQIAMAAAAAAQAHAQATSGSGEGITSPLSPWGFPSGQHSPVHLVHMAAANAANASATAGGSASPEQARQQQPIKAPTVRLGPVPAAVHPMSAHVQQAGQLTASSSSSSQPQPTRSSTTSSAPGSGAGQAQEQGEQAQGGDQDQEVVPAAMALTLEQGALQAPSQPNAAPAPTVAAATGATSASSSILAALALKRKQLDRPYPPHYMPTPRSTPPVNQQQGGQGQPDSREHRDRTDMSQHPASNLYQAYPPPPPVPLITPSGLPLGWHPSQPYPPLAAMPFQAQQHLATIGGTPATSGATTPNMDDTGSSSGRQRAGSAPPPGGRRGSARPGGAPMLDLPQPRTEGSPAPHPQQQGQQRSGSGSTSASPGPFMPANGNGQYQQQQQQQRSGQHHHGRTSYSAVGPHASAYDPSVGGAVGAAGVSSHSAAAALQPLVDPNQPGIHTAIVMHPPPHMQHAMLPPPGGPQQHHHQHMHQQQHHPHPAPPQAARASRIPIMDDDVVVLHTTDNMQRPFACIHCGRAFWRRYDCKRHMRVHTDERPYAAVGAIGHLLARMLSIAICKRRVFCRDCCPGGTVARPGRRSRAGCRGRGGCKCCGKRREERCDWRAAVSSGVSAAQPTKPPQPATASRRGHGPTAATRQ
ncbi:hypothetical protein BCR44DRAFT_1323289 [Catenaria anguillulae PL171]|uniref:C2H2-type domain-containing protein n=1 Tax=Catenaria anguillulae PL171 TaxID=765915 RepID=A0A1Y2HX97_9FUNG|nr:hypothetical protein BCR44DRAFT_1323289 [Catenaria anguillulae PL171]